VTPRRKPLRVVHASPGSHEAVRSGGSQRGSRPVPGSFKGLDDFGSPVDSGGRTKHVQRPSQAPMAWKLARATVRLSARFGPPRTSSASWSSWPSSSQKQTGQTSQALRSVNVMQPQQGHRDGRSAAGPSALTTSPRRPFSLIHAAAQLVMDSSPHCQLGNLCDTRLDWA
jgi:hypothetical protein